MDSLLSRVSIAVTRPCTRLTYNISCSSNAPVICNHAPHTRERAMDSLSFIRRRDVYIHYIYCSGVPFMVESTPYQYQLVFTVAQLRASIPWLAPHKHFFKVKNKLKRRNEYCLAVTTVQLRDMSSLSFTLRSLHHCVALLSLLLYLRN